jgi:hypothetical protein
MAKVYKDDVGTDIIVDTGVDISTATTAALKITKPDGTTATLTGSVYNSNYIKFASIASTFDQAGVYLLQAYVVMPAWTGHGRTITFKVYDDYK